MPEFTDNDFAIKSRVKALMLKSTFVDNPTNEFEFTLRLLVSY